MGLSELLCNWTSSLGYNRCRSTEEQQQETQVMPKGACSRFSGTRECFRTTTRPSWRYATPWYCTGTCGTSCQKPRCRGLLGVDIRGAHLPQAGHLSAPGSRERHQNTGWSIRAIRTKCSRVCSGCVARFGDPSAYTRSIEPFYSTKLTV